MIEVLLAALGGLCAWVILQRFEPQDSAVAVRIAALSGVANQEQVAGPGRANALLEVIGRKFPGASAGALTASVGSAGMRTATWEAVRGAQLVGAAAGFCLGLFAGALALILAPAGALLGYRLPVLAVARRVARRRERVALALPDAVDLLAVCSHAGLNLALSLRRVTARTGGVLGEELRRTLEEIDLGVPRQAAMQALSQRNPHGDLEALVSVLENAERFGNQVSASLETFAAEVRERRKRSAEEQARKAPVKILFPLVFFILPAFILLSVVPLLLSSFASLGLR